MSNFQKISAVCGIATPIINTVTVIIGGLLRPEYSHITQAISELFEVGAPNKTFIDTMIIICNILLIIFAFGLHRGINNGKGSKIGPVLLVLTGILGLLLVIFFPCDPGCKPITLTGTIHIPISFAMAFLSIFAILAFWRRLKYDKKWSRYENYSLVTFILAIFVLIIGSFFMTSPFMGLIERASFGIILQWIFVMAIKLFKLYN